MLGHKLSLPRLLPNRNRSNWRPPDTHTPQIGAPVANATANTSAPSTARSAERAETFRSQQSAKPDLERRRIEGPAFLCAAEFPDAGELRSRSAHDRRAKIQGSRAVFVRLRANPMVCRAGGDQPSAEQRTGLRPGRRRVREAIRSGIRGWHDREFHGERGGAVGVAHGSALLPARQRWIRASHRLRAEQAVHYANGFRAQYF